MTVGEALGDAHRASDGQHEAEGPGSEGRPRNGPVATAVRTVTCGAVAVVELFTALQRCKARGHGILETFLLGEGNLRRDFEITLVSCEDARAELELTPREPASFEKLRVVANPKTGDLSHTRIDDLLGNVTNVALSELETNVSPDPETFRFVAPEGVEVVELTSLESPGR